MADAKFTRAPWKVFRASNGKLLGIGDADGGGITDAYGGLWRSGKEMEANANLIAAAPELYEALADFVAMRDRYLNCPEVDEPEASQLLDEAHEKARAALAKALGQ